MSAIPWTVVEPDTIERMIAVGLCRRHKQARRIKPSQGDGGLDVLVPVTGQTQLHVENFQVKKFADGLNDSRERQIKKSLKRAIDTHNSADFGYRISRWLLALPMDLTREQEKWLFEVAAELDCPFPVEVFGLTQIEDLLLEAPDIREYYLGDGLDRIREAMVQMTNLKELESFAGDPLAIAPNDVMSSLAKVHRDINAADPHFDYDYQVTAGAPDLVAASGLVASVVSRLGPDAPYVTWHISTKYDTALEDRSIPGGYTVHPERMTDEQRASFERWRTYGTPVELAGDVIEDFTIDLPGGLGGPSLVNNAVLSIGPAIGEFEDEPGGRSRWAIEDGAGNRVAERLFSIRLKGRGLGGGEHRHGVDEEGYLTVDLYTKVIDSKSGSMQAKLNVLADRWVGEPVQRVLPAFRFVAAWTQGNVLRPGDEFGLVVSPEAQPLSGTSPISSSDVAAVEDLVRISIATKKQIALPGNIRALSKQRGTELRLIADAVSGLEPEVHIGELVLWHEDDPSAYADLLERADAGTLVVPWAMPFPLLGDDFHFDLDLIVFGAVVLEPGESDEAQDQGRRTVHVVPTTSTRGRLSWDPDRAMRPKNHDVPRVSSGPITPEGTS